jgi:6-pyruvoyl-tetrahydropterin synthase
MSPLIDQATTSTSIAIGGGEFSFCAAHAGLHDGEFEPLHGHTFSVTLRLTGTPNPAGMVADFGPVKAALREAIAPLRRRTLLPHRAPGVRITEGRDTVHVASPGKLYVFPLTDVVLLPVPNTTTEELAGYLLDAVLTGLAGARSPETGRWSAVELDLAEAPDVGATVRADISPDNAGVGVPVQAKVGDIHANPPAGDPQ